MRPMYKFLYDLKGRPIITICTLTTGGPLARGIAICSPMDIKAGAFCKKRGRVIAKGRALKALKERKSSCVIADRGFDNVINTDFTTSYLQSIRGAGVPVFKSAFDPRLNVEEQEHFDPEFPNECSNYVPRRFDIRL